MKDGYVLLVEDNAGDARLVQLMFDEAPAGSLPQLQWVSTVAAALAELDDWPECAAVLLDLGLPDADGLDALAALKDHGRRVPVIVLSGQQDEKVALGAVRAGAQDFLVKGSFDAARLRRVLHYASQRKRSEQAALDDALRDELTGLPRRTLLLDRLQAALHHSARDGTLGALLFIDLDQFKAVNDRHGHAAGDHVLRTVAQRLVARLRCTDTVARLGGDEFAVLLIGVANAPDFELVSTKLQAAIALPVELGDGSQVTVGASIGVIPFGDSERDADALLTRADAAMYVRKAIGRRAAADTSP